SLLPRALAGRGGKLDRNLSARRRAHRRRRQGQGAGLPQFRRGLARRLYDSPPPLQPRRPQGARLRSAGAEGPPRSGARLDPLRPPADDRRGAAGADRALGLSARPERCPLTWTRSVGCLLARSGAARAESMMRSDRIMLEARQQVVTWVTAL